jgi:hypothetical protein
MLLQISLQRRMRFYEVAIVDQLWILAKLFGSFAMGIEKLIEAGKFATGGVVVAG